MKHKSRKVLARTIDSFIDHYMKTRRTKRFPDKRLLEPIVKFLFGDYRHLGRGWYKNVYYVTSRNGKRELVLKMGHPKDIVRDFTISRRLSNRYFAKVYWRTKYCLLQKYGSNERVPSDVLERLKRKAGTVGLVDIKPANVRRVEGRFKIVDASISKGGKSKSI